MRARLARPWPLPGLTVGLVGLLLIAAAPAQEIVPTALPPAEGAVVDGARSGQWQRVAADGEVLWQGSYAAGVLDGPVASRHPNGRERFQVTFADGAPPERFVWVEADRRTRLELRYPRSVAEIVDHLARYYPSDSPATTLTAAPSFTAPYAAGATAAADRARALRAVQCYRYLSGLEWEHLEEHPSLTSHCQHGAVLLRRLNSGGHLPPRPSDMSQDFYEVAAAACKKSSLHGGSRSMAGAIYHFMAEVEPHNYRYCGHRRFTLNPHMNRTGFGFAGNITLMWAHDMSRRRPADYEYFTYPGEGYTPAALMSAAQPWSLYLNRRRYSIPDPEAVRVRVRELDEGLHPIAEIPVEFVYADDSRQWPTPAVNFRPRLRGTGEFAGRRFLVRVDGVHRGRRHRPIAWIVDFVDIGERLEARRQALAAEGADSD